MFEDITDILQTPLIAGVPLWACLIGAGFIGLTIYEWMKKQQADQGPPRISLHKAVKVHFKEQLDTFHLNLQEGSTLSHGTNFLGYIKRMTLIQWPFTKEFLEKSMGHNTDVTTTPEQRENTVLDDIKGVVTKKTKKIEVSDLIKRDFFLFEVGGNSIIDKITSLFKKTGTLVLVDEIFLRHDTKEFIINNSTQNDPYAGIIVFSEEGRQIVKNIAFKIQDETALEEYMNTMTKLAYFELKNASFSSRLREINSLSQQDREKQVDRMKKENN